MIATALALLAAAFTYQSDTTRTAREAFTRCLGQFVDRSTQSSMSAADFATQYPQACAAEQTAFREAIIRRDTAMRATRASAEESASLEVEDARVNFSERFEMSLPAQPRQQQAAATPAQPAAQPTATVQPAAQTTAQPAAQPASQPQ